ncbi:PREDICTED: progonadoliberin-1 isoform X2 [Corvus brachyrhynchos]|nr:PREDICTED: progonadoliberin-1 isoform X2 [Corvus brachyrhynchos]
MEKSRRIVASALLGVLCVGLCLAQHWSYGLQPGGKRSAGDLLGPFQEIANEMAELGEVQQRECPGSYQNSRIRDLKEAMGEKQQKDEKSFKQQHPKSSLENSSGAWEAAAQEPISSQLLTSAELLGVLLS